MGATTDVVKKRDTMKSKSDEILKAAKSAPRRRKLDDHLKAILRLRSKGWTYRQIETFLNEKGVKADHSTICLLVQRHEKKILARKQDGDA